MKALITRILIVGLLGWVTWIAYGGAFHGRYLAEPLKKSVSLRDGSQRARIHGTGLYFIGRSHFGGGYRGGK